MIRSVRNPIVNVCRAASAHQRFWAGIRVVRESTTPASSRIDQSPRQPNAHRMAIVGLPGVRIIGNTDFLHRKPLPPR